MIRTIAFTTLAFVSIGAFNVQAAQQPAGAGTTQNAAPVPMSERQKIDFLLDELAKSDVIFIRNGQGMTGAAAKVHLSNKMRSWTKPIITVDDFITNIATNSSQTGKPYEMKNAAGVQVKAADWFHKKLEEVTGKPAAAPEAPAQ